MDNPWLFIIGIAVGCLIWEAITQKVEHDALKERKKQSERTTK